MTTLNSTAIDALIHSRDIVQCAACGELSAHSWDLVTEKETYYRLGWDPGEIAHVGAASCFEWECGHCGAHHVKIRAPILAEVYTHSDPRQFRRRQGKET